MNWHNYRFRQTREYLGFSVFFTRYETPVTNIPDGSLMYYGYCWATK